MKALLSRALWPLGALWVGVIAFSVEAVAAGEPRQPAAILKLAARQPAKAASALEAWWSRIEASQRTKPHHEAYQIAIQGEIAFTLRRFQESAKAWLRVLQQPRYPGSLRFLAFKRASYSLHLLGRHKEAEEAIMRYARESLGYKARGSVLYIAAWLALYQKKYDRAAKLFEEFWQKYPKSSTIRQYWRGRWFQTWSAYQMGRYGEAIKGFQQMRKEASRYLAMRKQEYWIARSYERWGKREQAQRGYWALVERAPFSHYGLLALQRIMVDYKKELEAWCASAASKRGEAVGVWRAICGGRLTQGMPRWHESKTREARLQKAQREAQAHRQSFPMPARCQRQDKGVCASFHRARSLGLAGQYEKASLAIQQALQAIPPAPAQRLQMVRWLHAIGAHHAALLMLRKIDGITPSKIRDEERLRLHYPPAFAGALLSGAKKADLDPAMGWAILREESLYNTRALSHAAAYGLMQLIVPTAKKVAEHIQRKNFRPTELWEPSVNLRMGTWYLAQLIHKFGGNILLAAAAYNAGPHFVVAWTIKRNKMPLDEFVEEIFHTETRHYVKRVFQSYAMYSYLYRDRMPAILPPIKVEKSNKIDF